MAIVRIDFSQRQPDRFPSVVSDIVNSTMQSVLSVPPSENYIVCQGYPDGAILHSPGACPPERRAQIVFIQITLNLGRSAELKNRFFTELNAALVQTGLLAPENIFVNLLEVAAANWSFGLREEQTGL